MLISCGDADVLQVVHQASVEPQHVDSLRKELRSWLLI